MVPRCKSFFPPLTLNSSPHLKVFSIPLGVHVFVTVHFHPKADTSSAAIIGMIQKVQSAAALNTVIDEFNHLNFNKVLERCASACHSLCMPLRGSPGICYDSVSGTEVSSPDHHTLHLGGELSSGFWAVCCSLTFQGCLSTQTGLHFKKATASLTALKLYLCPRTLSPNWWLSVTLTGWCFWLQIKKKELKIGTLRQS